MTTVRQMLRHKSLELLAVPPHTSVYDALVLMAEHDVGALVVLDGDDLVGVFSERDYARNVILFGRSSRDLRVSDIMTGRVVCVRPDTTVDQCMAMMTARRIRHLPVLSGSQVVGLVSIGDVVKEMLHEQQFLIDRLEHYITT
jgi:CBS domain-containing protein